MPGGDGNSMGNTEDQGACTASTTEIRVNFNNQQLIVKVLKSSAALVAVAFIWRSTSSAL